MRREDLHHLRSIILDLIGYCVVYAPDFPERDGTSVPELREQITSRMAGHRATLRTEEQLIWQRMAEQELNLAFEAFAAGDRMTGSTQIQRAEEHFRRSFKPRKIRPDFVVGPDGQITPT
jgi:hypothetical protein